MVVVNVAELEVLDRSWVSLFWVAFTCTQCLCPILCTSEINRHICGISPFVMRQRFLGSPVGGIFA